MLHRLKPSAYHITRPLFRALDHHLAVTAIIEGTTQSSIYVDDPVDPHTAVTWIYNRIFLAGSPSNTGFNAELPRLFKDEIAPRATAAGRVDFIFYAPDGWEDQIGATFSEYAPLKDRRLYFTTNELHLDWRMSIPSDCTMQRVGHELLALEHLKNLDELVNEMQSERDSVDDFLNNSFGFCLVRGDEIVGWCLSEYNAGDRCEVGIETVERYRQQGYGTLTASALVEHALSEGITQIGWHCWASNEGSIALAKTAGYELTSDYPVFFAWFDALANFLVHGWFHLNRLCDYGQAGAWYEKAFQLGEAHTGAYYDAARAWALSGEIDAAFRNLDRALALGWADIARLKKDKDFTILQGTVRWQDLMRRINSKGNQRPS